MKTLRALIRRDVRLFFKDKGMFFTSMITPVILLVLYGTFLANVYREAFQESLAGAMEVSDQLIDACVGGQLVSSILAVSCITVAFCSNLLMVQDKANGTIRDLTISPVGSYTLALGYYIATLLASLLICGVAAGICLLYLYAVGWYFTVTDILLLLLDVCILTMLGTAMSSVIHFFLSTQGQMSAVGTIVSAGYGFISGAYMPIASYPEGLQKAISFLPGTYGTSLLRNHALRGVFAQMEEIGFPQEVVEAIRDSIDCNVYFFGNQVTVPAMYGILLGSAAILIAVYVLMQIGKGRR